jgi:hypothetical protein
MTLTVVCLNRILSVIMSGGGPMENQVCQELLTRTVFYSGYHIANGSSDQGNLPSIRHDIECCLFEQSLVCNCELGYQELSTRNSGNLGCWVNKEAVPAHQELSTRSSLRMLLNTHSDARPYTVGHSKGNSPSALNCELQRLNVVGNFGCFLDYHSGQSTRWASFFFKLKQKHFIPRTSCPSLCQTAGIASKVCEHQCAA